MRSLLVLARNYHTIAPNEPRAGAGRISRYAWGAADYHDVIHAQLQPLVEWIQSEVPGCRARGVVDTAPLLEREFAQLAGLGWQGKNTMLIHPRLGSWFFLAAVVTDLLLDYDDPFPADHCGRCRACLEVCPTNAFPQPYVLDASRCISYLTIELRTSIPKALRPALGDWVFGCDLCQEVCPWNRKSPPAVPSEFAPRDDLRPLPLTDLFSWTDADFRRVFRRTPLWRAKRRGLLRNAAIALGNAGHREAVPALRRGLQDEELLIRGASAWALGQLGGVAARAALLQHRAIEPAADVRDEIDAALSPSST